MPNFNYYAYFVHMIKKRNKLSLNKRRFIIKDKKITNAMYNRNQHNRTDIEFHYKICLNDKFRERLYKPGEDFRVIYTKHIIRNNGNTLEVKQFSTKI